MVYVIVMSEKNERFHIGIEKKACAEGCFSPLIHSNRYKDSTVVSDCQLLLSFPMEAVVAVSYAWHRTAGFISDH
ncbi:hypothetical protein [Nitrosospira multiformis]|uniref:hypothetical protein n=1 Tax=Nitrosospira multiformis TaxID=1231 RepID=UPI0015A52C63|nr:hypothetical protein [Nitrosospira multiformis]